MKFRIQAMTTSFHLQTFDLDPVEISHQAHRLFHRPLAVVVRKLTKKVLDRSKIAFPIVVANKHRIVSKPDNICAPIARQVNWEAEMLPNSPPTNIVTEVVDDLLFCLERAVTVVDCDIHTLIPEPNYISSLVAGEISDEPRIFSTRHQIEPKSSRTSLGV